MPCYRALKPFPTQWSKVGWMGLERKIYQARHTSFDVTTPSERSFGAQKWRLGCR